MMSQTPPRHETIKHKHIINQPDSKNKSCLSCSSQLSDLKQALKPGIYRSMGGTCSSTAF